MNQRLIRFDVRLHKDDYASKFWDEENRTRFLLRPETEWPLSIDPLVWPSVFFSKIFRDATKLSYGSIEVDPEIDGGKYWLTLEQMLAHHQMYKIPNARDILVAIHLFSEKSFAENMISYLLPDGIQAALDLGYAVPRECPLGSEFLGYDVADDSWISGLTNCEYTPEEKRRLSSLWVPRLNSFGLLNTLEDATEFRHLCDARVPGPAPFWVYGISQLMHRKQGNPKN